MENPLTQVDIREIRKAIAELNECEQCLGKMEACGMDTSEIRPRKDHWEKLLLKVNQVYSPPPTSSGKG